MRRYPYVHSYPHCWRCRTPLIYWGKPSWYIATSTRKDDLLAANATIDWHPAHIRDGRFGEWLSNNVDWALSRDRYWGTPLPIWRCGRGHLHCVGSLAELSELCGRDVTGIDPHRPVIDDVEFACPDCAEAGLRAARTPSARRVEPVIDAWFDSGSMPAAQVGYPAHARVRRRPSPSRPTSSPRPSTRRGAGSTRCWPSTRWCSVRAPYKHVVCLGHIVDADGRKMSKSLGNIIDPWTILDTRGADALRWWMFSQGSPWTPTRASLAAIDTAMRDMLLKLWNTFSFFTTYASLNGFDPADPGDPRPRPHAAPSTAGSCRGWPARWRAVTTALDAYEPLDAASALAGLVDDLSNWYVRRSRRRFWRTDPDAPAGDTLAAQATLHEVLTTLSAAAGPVLPLRGRRHVARRSAVPTTTQSVHLADWPTRPERTRIDRDLEAQMELARRLTSLGRAARSEAGVKVRQPLARALVFLPAGCARRSSTTSWPRSSTSTRSTWPRSWARCSQFELVAQLQDPRAAARGAGEGAQAGAGRARRRRGGGRRSRRDGSITRRALPAARSSSAPTTCSCGCGGSRASPCPAKGARWWPSTSPSTTPCATVAWPGRSSAWSRTCARTAGWTSPTASDLHLEWAGRCSTEHFDYIAREVLAVAIASGPGEGEGTVLDLETDEGRRCTALAAWMRKADGPQLSASSALQPGARALSSCGAGAWSAPRSGRHDRRRSSGAIRWRSMPSMCSPMASSQGGLPRRGQDDVDAAAVGRAVLTGDQSGLDHAVHQPGHAARGQGHLGAQPAHGQAALLGAPDVDQHVEPDQGDADRLLQLAAEQSVSWRWERRAGPSGEPLVVDLPRTPQVPPVRVGIGVQPHRRIRPAGEFRRAHVLPQSLPELYQDLPVYLIDKYLYSQILSGQARPGRNTGGTP